jgi:hypothetical protein
LANCQSPTKKIEYLRSKISEAQQATQEKRREAKDNIERHAKAKWVISLSIHRVIYLYLYLYIYIYKSSWFSVCLMEKNKIKRSPSLFCRLKNLKQE